MKRRIQSLCERYHRRVVAIRRDLHTIPEASFEESKTSAKIASYLRRAGIACRPGVAKTGVVALIKGKTQKTVAIRADMDALNIVEQTGLPFASEHKGFMHACGHDGHMAMVLGAGMVLASLGEDLPGNVRLIFQPGEETPPGGALAMIRGGALRSPRASAIVGLHVDPALASGKAAVKSGIVSAAADDFRVTIAGRGGHGSSPHRAIDAVVVAAQFIVALQAVVSRRVSALDSVVVSIGRISGGERSNVIAQAVDMEGTIRTKKARMRRRVPEMIKEVLEGTCRAFGARGTFKYLRGYPAVDCDPELSALVRKACGEVLGPGRVVATSGFEMGGEDFAYYAREVPGTVIFVGVRNRAAGKVHPLHHSQFDLDEDALKAGVSALAYSAYSYLKG